MKRPIKAVLYSHSHLDHYAEVKAYPTINKNGKISTVMEDDRQAVV